MSASSDKNGARPAPADAPVAGRRSRVWLVEDHQLFRELIADFLSTVPTIEIVGSSPDEEPLFAACAAGRVDVAILDLHLRGTGGMRVLAQLAEMPRCPAVMILSATATEHSVHLAVRLGAKAYIDKAASLDEVIVALDRIAQGGVYFSEAPRRILIEMAARGRRIESDPATARETEVLARFGHGAVVKEVADELNLSKWAVYRIRGELRRKLDLRDDKELVAYALRIGLVDDLPDAESAPGANPPAPSA